MSGTVTGNVFKSSGVIEATSASLNWSSAVITASTLTASAGNGYFINTSSNACTVTLPASPAIGDQIVFADYARTWATNNLIIDSNGNNFQGESDLYTVDYSTAGQSLNIVYSDATKGWLPVSDDAVANVPVPPPTQKAIMAFGGSSAGSNLITSSGVVGSDVTRVGTARSGLGANTYGTDKAIFAFGSGESNLSNLVNNNGVVASDGTGVGTGRQQISASGFGTTGQAIFAYGTTNSAGSNLSNLVSNQGVVASDTAGVGTARGYRSSVSYGADLAVFGYGYSQVNTLNRVSNTGVVSGDESGVGTARRNLVGAQYGVGLGIFVYGEASGGSLVQVSNKVSFTGVVASDVSNSGTGREVPGGAPYGGDKGIIYGGGTGGGSINTSNLISNSGVVGNNVTGVGTARSGLAGAGYSISA